MRYPGKVPGLITGSYRNPEAQTHGAHVIHALRDETLPVRQPLQAVFLDCLLSRG